LGAALHAEADQLIRFPRMHIAASVVNRILNVADDLPQRVDIGDRSPTSMETASEGVALDAKIQQPLAPVSAEPPLAEQVALKTLLR
jgi:hypothetical protein